MNPILNRLSRRTALKSAAAGFGYLAFAGLSTFAAEKEKDSPLAPKAPHFPARAKHVIFLCMEGAPSHVDTFDYKPKLKGLDGQSMPGARTAFAKLFASPWKFNQSGQSGLWISELFPELSKQADELCLLRGMHTDVPAHPQAFLQMHTGIFQFKRPSMGAWTLYGLGTENENLPGFITVSPPLQNGGPANYGSAFLPAVYQATPIRGGFGGGPAGMGPLARLGGDGGVANIKNPRQSADAQREQLDFIQSLNQETLDRQPHDAEVEGAIQSFELAFRMQKDLPKVMDLSTESEATKALYGIGDQTTDNFGRQCLLARKFVEAGVRFVEITSGQWDHHRDLKNLLGKKATSVDKPIAGLLQDLKARAAQGHADPVGRRIRPDALCAGRRRPRPQQPRLHDVDGRRRRQGRLFLRRDRRLRLRGRGGQDAHPRLARDHPVPARPGPREADVPLCRPRHAADGRGGERGQGRDRIRNKPRITRIKDMN